MALFRRHDPRGDAVSAQLAELDQRLAQAQVDNAALQVRLASLETRPLPPPVAQPDPNDLAAKVRVLLGDPPPAIDPRRIDQLEAGRDRLELRIAELSGVVTNQLSELGGEIDTIEHVIGKRLAELEARLDDATAALAHGEGRSNGNGSAPPNAADQAVLAQLRENQVRIANELARFSIAIREEMAQLAPRVSPTSRS
jgi:hypothetical protein